MAKELEELLKKKQQLKDSAAAKEKQLEALEAKLKNISKVQDLVWLPLFKVLTFRLKNGQSFQQHIPIIPFKQSVSEWLPFLPPGLFAIYSQAMHYSECFGMFSFFFLAHDYL